MIVVFAAPCFPEEGTTITGKDGAAMALIKRGAFFMGSPLKGEFFDFPPEENPRHKVHVDDYYMDTYEVTNKQFAQFLNVSKPSLEERRRWVVIRDDIGFEDRMWPTEITSRGSAFLAVTGFEDYPVVSVSWFGADAYCRWFGKRLPTEAEWEKAARGGLQDELYPWGNALPSQGVTFKRTWKDYYNPAPVQRVGTYYPNGYGLYDMAGNVSEWCSDWYDPLYYQVSPESTPQGPTHGTARVMRGESWASHSQMLRVGFRGFVFPDNLDSGNGFRCVQDAR